MTSSIRVNLSGDSEAALSQQVNMELYASYVYQSLASWAAQDDIALPGLAKYCLTASEEERSHGQQLIDYLNMRGGRVKFMEIKAPPSEWSSALDVMQAILDLEVSVYKSLLSLHKVASDADDPQMTDFIEGTYLKEQVEDIKKVGDLLTRLKRAGGDGLGLVYWDNELLEAHSN